MSAVPLAWLMVGRTGHRLVFDASQVSPDIGARYAASGWEVTPLVAAPPPDVAEEVTTVVDDLIVAALNTESCGDPYHDGEKARRALARCRADLIALVSVAAPLEDGRPTWDELASALRDTIEALDMGFISRAESRRNAEALLSRLPKEEP